MKLCKFRSLFGSGVKLLLFLINKSSSSDLVPKKYSSRRGFLEKFDISDLKSFTLLLVGAGQNLRPFSRTFTSDYVKILSDKFMVLTTSFEFIAP